MLPSRMLLLTLLLSCTGDKGEFTARNTEPTGSIISPLDRSTFVEGEPITFMAEVGDLQDSPQELSIYWTSDEDGALIEAEHPDSEGIHTFSTTLSPTRHLITMTVVDIDGASAEDSISITVSDLAEPPEIAWGHPLNGEYGIEGEAFEFVVQVSDYQDQPSDLTITLASDVDGEFCTPNADVMGVASCDATLSVEDHYLTATVTDLDGNSTTASAYFQVVSDQTIDDDEDGWNEDQGDCDDDDPSVHPTADEYANGFDDDCDGSVDEGTSAYDDDGDCYCEEDLSSSTGCTGSDNAECDSLTEGDCDDEDDGTYPGATESCDDVDNDCDTIIDEDTECSDDDGDGYTEEDGDCNDGSAVSFPDGTEVLDGLDNDCDGAVDERTSAFDDDGDCYCETEPCTGSVDSSCTTLLGDDCNDATPAISPGATESCDGLDNDCDSVVDDGTSCYDDDGDTFTELNGDCDDANPATHPGATEIADGADNDCDGTVDEGTSAYDDDGDGYTEDGGDCDDADPKVSPAEAELCNDVDDDCNGAIDDSASDASLWYADADGDSAGDASVIFAACDAPAGYVGSATDCDDTDNSIYPDAPELCDGEDDDCDGTIDEGATDAPVWYSDGDGDTYGDATVILAACDQPAGYVGEGTDCDDADPAVFPDADELCNGVDDNCDGDVDEDVAIDAPTWYRDSDGDTFGDASVPLNACDIPTGYAGNATDCDDGDSSVHPGSAEDCDGVDDDCDGAIDEGVTPTWYQDADGDSFGTASVTADACTAPTGFVGNTADCDDTRSAVNPDADELCNSIDDDCNGFVDEDSAVDGDLWYADDDGDGYGDVASTTTACSQPSGYVGNAEDCDDGTALIAPGVAETCNSVDDDCDGTTDEDATDASPWYRDSDNDAYGDATNITYSCSLPAGYVADDTDCDDSDLTVHPGAAEACDEVDDDCDGVVDEGVQTTYYADADGDNYGDVGVTTLACTTPTGFVANDDDCNDANADIAPGATEYCNSLDDDCDGLTDESAADRITFYADDDSDGFGDPTSTTLECSQPTGYVLDDSDCDDTDPDVWPGADEYCNSVDDDCDGSIDEGDALDPSPWFRDADGDTYGDASVVSYACDIPSGYAGNDDDCDDASSAIKPGAAESCNSIDDDCDGSIDEGVLSTFYRDADGDSYGDSTVTTLSCSAPSGYVTTTTDCNDTDSGIHPGATEFCNGLDDDCDTVIDDGATDPDTWYRDADGDGYGGDSTTTSCTQPSGYVGNTDDCDDTRGTVYPGATEYCNNRDDDCDGTGDEDDAVDASTWYRDADADTYGDPSVTTTACELPSGYAGNDDDCDDASSVVRPGASETCNSIDDDCDGSIDEGVLLTWYRDADSDTYGNPSRSTTACTQPSGYVSNDDDCDDRDADLTPNTVWYIDADADGYGNSAYFQQACSQPTGYVDNADDCNDGSSAARPGATERCDSLDNDCDGATDEANATSCTTYYYDYDGDGFGTTATQCLCTGTGYYTATAPNDCYDYNANANPNTTTYYSTSRGDGSYDYNCDSVASKRYTAIYSCSALCTSSTSGWTSTSSPSCGTNGTWGSSCTWDLSLSLCAPASTSSRTQSCR